MAVASYSGMQLIEVWTRTGCSYLTEGNPMLDCSATQLPVQLHRAERLCFVAYLASIGCAFSLR